jgi:DNA-binding NtrC family response regulator
MAMNHSPNKKDEELERMKAEFLKKGGEVTVGKTKAMPSELGISNNTWNNKLTKTEKNAKNKKTD